MLETRPYVLLFFIKSFLAQEPIVAEEVSRFALCLSCGHERDTRSETKRLHSSCQSQAAGCLRLCRLVVLSREEELEDLIEKWIHD
jgi:hypothetical protein